MIWNHLLHIAAGIIGKNIFTWSKEGIIAAIIITGVVQLIDTIRMYFYHKKLILNSPLYVQEEKMKNFKEGALLKLSQLYVLKLIWYSLVTLLAAAIARHLFS